MRVMRKMLQMVLSGALVMVLALPFLPAVNGELLADAVQNGKNTVAAEQETEQKTEQEMRGVWVSSVINLDYPQQPTVSAAELKAQADEILDGAVECGFNAVFLQVRPCADALYDSDIFPWSIYLTGTQGEAPEDGFDPLAYWVKAAHQRGLELHAWLNPYRVTRAAAEWDKLSVESPAKKHPEWVVEYQGKHYFDPANDDVRQMLIDGAVEIVEGYDVDGIHLDDYFYPGTDFPDEEAFAASGAADIGDWRRDNVNRLIQGMDKALHRADPDIEFGVSPAGIWASNTLNSEGSGTTSTYSSYYNMYADSKKWVKEGWVDYIAPQIYWEAGHKTADFTALLDWWCDTVDGTGVDLYIGLADYKTTEAKAADSPWYGGAEIARQLTACALEENVSGTIHFRYSLIKSSNALQSVISDMYSDKSGSASGETGGNTADNSGNNSGSNSGTLSGGAKGVTVLLDMEQLVFDQQPYIKEGRVMLPMRVIFEALGATVDYDAGRITAQRVEKSLSGAAGSRIVRLELGSDKMYINDGVKTLDVPAFAEGGRTYVPLRAVSEAYDCLVDWDNATKTVSISSEPEDLA